MTLPLQVVFGGTENYYPLAVSPAGSIYVRAWERFVFGNIMSSSFFILPDATLLDIGQEFILGTGASVTGSCAILDNGSNPVFAGLATAKMYLVVCTVNTSVNGKFKVTTVGTTKTIGPY